MSEMFVENRIQHYQRIILKYTSDEERILHCLSRLSDIPVTVKHLQLTGIGRTVNALRKFEGEISNLAEVLVAKWEKMHRYSEQNNAVPLSLNDSQFSNNDSNAKSYKRVKDTMDQHSKKHITNTENYHGKRKLHEVNDERRSKRMCNSGVTEQAVGSSAEVYKKRMVHRNLNFDEDGGIDSQSGASFAEALGMCAKPAARRKRANNSKLYTPMSTSLSQKKIIKQAPLPIKVSIKLSSLELDTMPLPLILPHRGLGPINLDFTSTLSEVCPDYNPLPSHNPDPIMQQRKEECKKLNELIYTKNRRTKVYSGVVKRQSPLVPSLKDLCIRTLIPNINAIKYTGRIPFDFLKPVLQMATVEQLFRIEHHNPYLIQDTDNLWEYFCKKNFRSANKEVSETWREMYLRCMDEQNAKLERLTAQIKQNLIEKTLPVRTIKLAYVENEAKPPPSVLRKQAKCGTARDMQNTVSDSKKKLISVSGNDIETNISVPPPSVSRPRPNFSSRTKKKTKAPLMAKALQMMTGRYKR